MAIYLSTPNKKKHSEEGKNGNMRYGAAGMQGWRTDMEDEYISKYNIALGTHIFGVFDGHGGKEVAKFVGNNFIKELLANESFKKMDYEKALIETFLLMDELLSTPAGKREVNAIRAADGKSEYNEYVGFGAGCTANVALIVGKTLYVANAGDSRAVLCSKGQAVEMSVDHDPDDEKERTRVQKGGGCVSDGRIDGDLNISRAIGDLEYKRNSKLGVGEQLIIAVPDVKKRELTPDDEFIVMGCDGIWEVKSNQVILDFVGERIKKGILSLSKIAEELLDSLLAPDIFNEIGCDNMTCIIVTLSIQSKMEKKIGFGFLKEILLAFFEFSKFNQGMIQGVKDSVYESLSEEAKRKMKELDKLSTLELNVRYYRLVQETGNLWMEDKYPDDNYVKWQLNNLADAFAGKSFERQTQIQEIEEEVALICRILRERKKSIHFFWD